MIKKAIAKRAQPESVMFEYFLKSQAVSGHAEIAENSANQPFVIGSGPWVITRPKPPMPAMTVQAQAANHPNIRPGFRYTADESFAP